MSAQATLQNNSFRVDSIDLLRGTIMIIMALDHTRDYFHADAFQYDPSDPYKTNAILFFTRWITHFCAPLFVLLAGTSAFLSAKNKAKKDLAFSLIKRGLSLILIEIVIINFAWSFNIHLPRITLGVLWALGVSMMCLAGFIWLPKRALLSVGLLIVFAHNLLDSVHIPGNNFHAFLWGLLHDRRPFTLGDTMIRSSYPLIPWIGVMALGYVLGNIFTADFNPSKRKRILVYIGSVSVLLFILIRQSNVYGDPVTWSSQLPAIQTVFSFLNVTKYPPSLDFLLMTLGPGFLFLGFTETLSNKAKIILTYGKVPLFYYIIHLYLIHLLAVLAALLSGFKVTDMVFTTALRDSPNLKGYGFELWVVYLIWIALVIGLYPMCNWFTHYKEAHRSNRWVRYL